MKKIFFFLFVQINFLSAQPLKQDTLHLIFAGDIMNHLLQIQSAEIIENKEYDYTPCFKYVKPILSKADLAIGNLELTLPGVPPYTGYPVFKSPNQLAEALKTSGFDVLVTANNHSNDSGVKGLVNTIKELRSNGFLSTGTFANSFEKELYHPMIIYRKGFRIALLNYTFGTNGIPTRFPTIVNQIEPNQIKADLDLAGKMSPDYTIVFIHWGKESELEENEDQVLLAQKMQRWGADLIIGAHPHVVQSIKNLGSGTSGNQNLVVYSLGNFISHQMKPHTDIGILFEVFLTKERGKTILADHNYIPLWRYIQRQENKVEKFFTLPASAFTEGLPASLEINRHEILKMQTVLQRLRSRLKNSDSKERKISLHEIENIKL